MSFAKGLSVLFLAVVAVAVGAGPAAAADKKADRPSHVILADALHQLRSINHTLEMANHDYGGHRAAAVHDIKAAEKQIRLLLDHVHKHYQPKKGEKHPKDIPLKEPQLLSDQQLADAIPELRYTVQHIKDAGHDFGGHKDKAIKDLDTAIVQLENALKFSKELNKDKP